MTKPRITASMLRKRPKPAEPAPMQQGEPEGVTEAAFDLQAGQSGSMVDNPSFRAPQFGIKPRVAASASVRVQHSPKRRFESERAS